MIWVAFEKMCKLSTTINVNSIFNENRIPVVKSKTDKVPVIKMDLNKPDDLKKKYQEFSIFNEDLKGPVLNPTQKNKISNIVQKTRFQSNSVINEDASKIFTVNTSENKQVEKKVKEKEINRLSQPGTSEKVDDVMQLFRQLGTAYTYQLSFNCAEAINIYTSLPKQFSKIGWVLSNLGKCYFEMVKYNEAEKTYSELLKLEPCRLEALDYYSTCLWHLKKQTELCWLSNHVLDTWLYSPEGWVAVGNCFSIQREHEAAIKFFQRAIQLNPNYAYAYTLCGHEFVSNEDFESGKKAYQKAISIDDKHYNAWWGYGNVCMKQEKYNDAIKYFKAAIEINDRSSVLYTYLGMAYFNNSMMKEAMDSYNKGESVDPKNPLTKFQKAVLLTSIGENKKALDLLLALCEIVPREAPVHILLGKLYNMQGNKEEAHKHFIMAMDLEPKNIASTKLLIDTIGINDVKMEDNEIL
jgi:anaphase-promoting complex subunit 3